MKAVVYTLGCKVNDVESGSIIRGLEEMGFQVSREMEKADLYVINTCAVTNEAERKSRQTVGKAIKCNPDAKIIVCGCASEKSPQAFMEKGMPKIYEKGDGVQPSPLNCVDCCSHSLQCVLLTE